MTRIVPINLEHATEATRPLLDGIQKKIGFLPNVFRVLAHAPAVLASYMQGSVALGKTSLSALEKESIFLATSQANGCDYCLAAHTLFASKAGYNNQEILSAREGKLDAFALLAKQITESRGHLTNEQIAQARAAGIDDAKIIEVIAHVASQTLTNYLNNVALTDIDFPSINS
ncbi:carboxymuconolactone decarboxylase family protein [Pseudomonas sp. KK4]|uniref:carboxymuconolactone decarboxylase family protein n=1 Tax=Pseudomonas sp. KK4 TaxID=1855729 RepID=UPI00097C9C63|nr:carboxymuconolactone decarboxylase family protein [Pseudomonas sp. KK4]